MKTGDLERMLDDFIKKAKAAADDGDVVAFARFTMWGELFGEACRQAGLPVTPHLAKQYALDHQQKKRLFRALLRGLEERLKGADVSKEALMRAVEEDVLEVDGVRETLKGERQSKDQGS